MYWWGKVYGRLRGYIKAVSQQNLSLGFPTGPYTNGAVQPQKVARGLKFRIYCTIYVAKTKALISRALTVQLICTFVFANAKCRFSHDAALSPDRDDYEGKTVVSSPSAQGELIVYRSSRRLSVCLAVCLWTFSNLNISATSGPIITKF